MHTPLAPDSILSFPLQTDDGSDGNWATGTMSVDEAGAWKMWIHSTNDQGCEHFDSNLGANYEMQILRRPEWAGNLQVIASETVDQATPFDASRFWVDRRAMVNRVSFEAGDASFLSQDMTPNPQAFRASVHYRYRGEFAWRTIAATYEHQGDKLLFSLPLHAIDPFSGDAENPQCPEVPYIIPEYGSVQTEVELYASVNGKSLRPESSRTIRLIVHRNVGRWLPQDCTSND